MKAAIIVGSRSMLGRSLSDLLSADGVEVFGAGRDADDKIVIKLGANQQPVIPSTCSADVLFHCASAFGGNDATGLRENLLTNVAGCAQVLDLAQQAGVSRIVYAGTVFSDINSKDDPMAAYGFSKAEAERILDWGMACTYGRFCSLRLSQLWDTDGMCCKHQPWFGRIIAYASRGLTLRLPPARGKRNFMHVSDAARLMLLAASNNLSGIWSASHPENIDLLALASESYRVFNRGGSVTVDDSKTPFRDIDFPHDDNLYQALKFWPRIGPLESPRMIHDAGTAERFGPVDVR